MTLFVSVSAPAVRLQRERLLLLSNSLSIMDTLKKGVSLRLRRMAPHYRVGGDISDLMAQTFGRLHFSGPCHRARGGEGEEPCGLAPLH